MREQTRQRAVMMLSDLLESGHTYREVGGALGIGHSTVERQVKALIWKVARTAPIPGVPDVDLASLGLLRAHACAVMDAVRSEKQHDECHSPADFDESDLLGGIRRIRRLSQNANRDVALLLTMLCTGAKPLEVARLQVQDYLAPDGTVRRQSTLRGGSSLKPRRRVVFFDTERVCDAVDAYLEERVRRRVGVGRSAAFRGVDPNSALFLTESGRPFQIKARGANDPRPTCPVLLATYAGIFKRAGWPGVNTQHIRRLFAQRLAGKGADAGQLGELLGVTDRRSVKRLLERPQRPLAELIKDLL